MSKAQYDFHTKFCSQDKKLLQCTHELIRMFSFRKTVEEKVLFVSLHKSTENGLAL